MQLYFQINFNKVGHIERIIDYYVPLTLNLSGFSFYSDGEYRVSWNSEKHLTMLGAGKKFGELYDITNIKVDQLFFFNSSLKMNYLTLLQAPACLPNQSTIEKQLLKGYNDDLQKVEIKYFEKIKPCNLEIYNNAILIRLPAVCIPYYAFNSNKSFTVLTDKDFNVIAFISWGITEEEKRELKEYAIRHSINSTPLSVSPLKPERPPMTEKNKNCLIQKILNLKNIDLWKVIYFGYERNLIDTSFIVDFAIEYLAQSVEPADQLTLEIASLLKNQYDQVPRLFEKHVQNRDAVITTDGQKYNKIWFYLTLAADMCEDKIIE